MALLWTPSIKLISLLRYGLHAWQQYFKCGITRLLYSCMTVSFDLCWKSFLLDQAFLFAFFTASMHCLSHFISALTVTPKSFSSLTNCNFTFYFWYAAECVSINGPGDLDLWPYGLETGMRVPSEMGNLHSEFGHAIGLWILELFAM